MGSFKIIEQPNILKEAPPRMSLGWLLLIVSSKKPQKNLKKTSKQP